MVPCRTREEILTFASGQMGFRQGQLRAPIRLHVQATAAAPGADHTRPKPRQVSVGGVIVSTKHYFMATSGIEARSMELVRTQFAHVGERH